MQRRERVLEAVKKRKWDSLAEVDEVWKSDHEVVLAAVQADGHALQFAAEMLKGDPEIVLSAVRQNGYALKYATEAIRADRDVVLAAVRRHGYALRYATGALRADREVVQAAAQQHALALRYAADVLLEDPTFATEAKKKHYHLLKLTMLSGRSTVVTALSNWGVEMVLDECRSKLGLEVDRSTMELWHDSGERVPDHGTEVEDWPGMQPKGEISEYQLLLRRE